MTNRIATEGFEDRSTSVSRRKNVHPAIAAGLLSLVVVLALVVGYVALDIDVPTLVRSGVQSKAGDPVAHDAGVQAAKRGWPMSACPWEKDSPRGAAWCRGWLEGRAGLSPASPRAGSTPTPRP